MSQSDGILINPNVKLLNSDEQRFWQGITSIGDNAFLENKDLAKINIPESVVSIGNSSFYGTNNLRKVSLPESLETINNYAFANCKRLNQINFPTNLKTIGGWAFSGCYGIMEAHLPNTLTHLGAYAFDNCRNLKHVTLSDNLETMSLRVFYNCSNLIGIEIPSKVKRIESLAFYNCSKLEKVKLNEGLVIIEDSAFEGCEKLKEIKIPSTVKTIQEMAFRNCKSLNKIYLSKSLESIDYDAFSGVSNNVCVIFDTGFNNLDNITRLFDDCHLNIKHMYIKNKKVIFSSYALKENDYEEECSMTYDNIKKFLKSENYYDNYLTISKWKKEGKVKFIPPFYILDLFPSTEIKNFYHQKNYLRWGKLIKDLKIDTIESNILKQNSLDGLFKIYYAIGGFSTNQGKSEDAYHFIKTYMGKKYDDQNRLGEMLHLRFSGFKIENEAYNPEFAYFFKKYYKNNSSFMTFRFSDAYGNTIGDLDYLSAAHNNFKRIRASFPNMLLSGNSGRNLLTPEFVAMHSSFVKYEGVNKDNEHLAFLLGTKGYSQAIFDKAQNILLRAKKIKDNGEYVFKPVNYNRGVIEARVLDKDDEYGFVIGDETNCCQRFNDCAESCVIDGFTSTSSGFVVLEEHYKDENGVSNKRIIGQAYVFYDPTNKCVCYDNIEIPRKVLGEISHREVGFNKEDLITTIENLSVAIIRKMNEDGYEVNSVTSGVAHNDMYDILNRYYKRADNATLAKNPNMGIYTDAKEQYLIMNKKRILSRLKSKIEESLTDTKVLLDRIDKKINSTKR